MSDSDLTVCHVIAGFAPTIGGAEKATETLARAMAAEGVGVTVLTRRIPGTVFRSLLGPVQVYRAGLPVPGKLGALSYGLHGVWLLATRLRSYRVLHVQSPFTPLLLAVLARIILRRRIVATIHSVEDLADRKGSALWRLRLIVFRRFVDRFTAISSALVDELSAIGIERDNIEPIPNPVDTQWIAPPRPEDRASARESLGLKAKQELTVLFVGRLVALKQVDDLLAAFQLVAAQSDASLVVVGDGPQAPLLRVRANTLGLGDRVVFTGMLEDVRPALMAADAFVLPSRQEGLSVALIEAQSAGIACLVSDLPGNRELVTHGFSGIVFPVGDIEELARALVVLKDNPELRAQLGYNGRRSVVAKYSVERVMQLHLDLYRRLSREAWSPPNSGPGR